MARFCRCAFVLAAAMFPSVYSGTTRCLYAFIVALSQASEGGDKRWYASILQLQLASLELCEACRSVRTLRVRVRYATPRSVWCSRQSKHRPIKRSWEKCRISSRVPVGRAVSLTWGLPLGVRVRTAATELWQHLAVVGLVGSICASSLQSVTWPRGPRRWVLSSSAKIRIGRVSWPNSLQQLWLGYYFNQPITGVVWPTSLLELSLGCSFNQRIAGVGWPASLLELSFVYSFNQPINEVVWPASLQRVSFGHDFAQSITAVKWPASLMELSFWSRFNQPITAVVWPDSLQKLSFGRCFNQPAT